MTNILTAAQMRSIEAQAIESGQVTGLTLMERAGKGVVEAVLEHWPDMRFQAQKVAVLCGPGNNGGDGFVIARLLYDRGWPVEVFLLGDPDALPPDARHNLGRWVARGTVTELTETQMPDPEGFDLVVDALFGTGLKRPLTAVPGLRARLRDATTRQVAVDMPSGLCADSGRVLGARGGAMTAGLTVSFHAKKRGHLLADGPQACGHVVVSDIGLTSPREMQLATCVEAPEAMKLFKKTGHKFTYGHALVLSGGAGRTGAARLAARAALRVGAGLVTLGVPPSAQQEVACQITALMVQRLRDAAELQAMLEDTRLNALLLGPGMGLHKAAADLTLCALSARWATVLDADALTLVAGDDRLRNGLHSGCVLTPHMGEFRRLYRDLCFDVEAVPEQGPAVSKCDAVQRAARRAGCVVLLKGADTVIAAPDGRVAVHAAAYERAAPWLATAGSGDVLAGIITGLMAQGLDPFEAAQTGAWLHAECAIQFGPGLIAEDLPEQIPHVYRGLAVRSE